MSGPLSSASCCFVAVAGLVTMLSWAPSAAAAGARAQARAPAAVVEAVQMPAWVERAGSVIPLEPGMDLRPQDRVRTGRDARILLRTGDGSAVKIGEQGSVNLEHLRVASRTGVFEAALDVAQGAFRFTTAALTRVRGRRVVDVTIATVTVGIRGTDVWGKAEPDRDVLVLIEGRVDVRRGSEAPFVMDQPQSFYEAPRNEPGRAVVPVDPRQLQIWAQETEIQPGRGASRRGGRWQVVLATVETQAEALGLYDTLRAAGYPARIIPDDAQGRRVYRVRMAQLPSRAEAQALAAALAGRFGISAPVISR